MTKYPLTTIGIAAILTVGTAMMFHELAHVITGWLAGGHPTLLCSAEVLGDFKSLTPGGFSIFGASGSLVNIAFCILGWWMLRRAPGSPEFTLTAWFLFAFNGALVGTKMMGEAAAGFGDLMSVLRPFADPAIPRAVVFVLGTAGVAFFVRRGGRALARIIPQDSPDARVAEARRVVLFGALVSGILVTGSAISGPNGSLRGTLLALGAGIGPFIPLFFGTRFARTEPPASVQPVTNGGNIWTVAAGAVVVMMWFVVGPGIDLSGLLP